jgi:putative transposase
MPRLARLDTPGAVHHIIIRGIERRSIFRDNCDRDDFIDRLATLLPETKTACYAWTFMPNHAHFLFRSGEVGLSTLMRKLLTGYAVTFNKRHNRHGQLFQNRCKSIICQEDVYLTELVRYIHLNPLRGGLVSGLEQLNAYPWCGHGTILGKNRQAWQDTEYVLNYFGKTLREGRKRYFSYVEAGVDQGRRKDLVGGGLIRSHGGWAEVKKRRLGEGGRIKGDERILGQSDFVLELLAKANENLDRRHELKSLGYNLERVAERVSEVYGVGVKSLLSKRRERNLVEARSLLCYWAVRELEMSLTELARTLKMTPSAISYAVSRGETLAKQRKVHLIS